MDAWPRLGTKFVYARHHHHHHKIVVIIYLSLARKVVSLFFCFFCFLFRKGSAVRKKLVEEGGVCFGWIVWVWEGREIAMIDQGLGIGGFGGLGVW